MANSTGSENIGTGKDSSDKENQSPKTISEKTSAAYKSAFTNTLDIREEFSNKKDYIREKQPDEIAYQGAKKVFGEFKPDEHAPTPT